MRFLAIVSVFFVVIETYDSNVMLELLKAHYGVGSRYISQQPVYPDSAIKAHLTAQFGDTASRVTTHMTTMTNGDVYHFQTSTIPNSKSGSGTEQQKITESTDGGVTTSRTHHTAAKPKEGVMTHHTVEVHPQGLGLNLKESV
ncbi:hypothetical protein K439DRAFT_558805 [Ramaria rubella]|nr:hypothetical protein K439DRAFT_558805 [Ramaria rubella]